MQSKSKERKSEAMQVERKSCNTASSGIKTLKVKKIVRVARVGSEPKNGIPSAAIGRDACPPLKSDDQRMNQERSRFQEEGGTVNYRRRFKHSAKIVVNSYEASTIIGLDGGNVKNWSGTQATVAQSSGEAEYYAMVRSAAEALSMKAIMKDLGWDAKIVVWADS